MRRALRERCARSWRETRSLGGAHHLHDNPCTLCTVATRTSPGMHACRGHACGTSASPPRRVCGCSWLQKLEVAKELLVERAPDMRPGLEALAPVYIYLQWIATGSIACVEGGGHFRPNRHAGLGKLMFRSLEWVAGDGGRSDIERMTACRMQVPLPPPPPSPRVPARPRPTPSDRPLKHLQLSAPRHHYD
jgi:hypothetical protein